ncbi:MAG: leucyl aminopeptidase family protein [Rhizobiaceae bacterium]|nr:leucyl aminopeptidase family protein [Rhizobiaceae bacterium]
MPVELLDKKSRDSRPIHLIGEGGLREAGLDPKATAWAEANEFTGKAGRSLLVPAEDGSVAAALFGTGKGRDANGPLSLGALARVLPEGDWHFAAAPADPDLSALAVLLGGYRFTRYGKKAGKAIRLALPKGADAAAVRRRADAITMVRDLVNAGSGDMGPDELEQAAKSVAKKHKAKFSVIRGDDLLERGFPMIHAVGRASTRAPRLIDFSWGRKGAPKVTLVGKGVCFDTGGLDIKPAAGMLAMKKDMGGAAHVLGLAAMIMGAGLDIRLRVLIPAVENAISGNAFRPGDVLRSRKGLTVEIGNTDAEGRLILADALTLADADKPDLLIDMATLTGAARVALGPDLPPFYTDDDGLAASLSAASHALHDPLWRMPLWRPYDARIDSKVADINNSGQDGMAGSITAALFLRRFVDNAAAWVHFDIFAWNPADRPFGVTGGEAQGIRALEKVLMDRYAKT